MKFTLLYDQEQSKAELIERLILKPWQGYCLKNWLNENHAQIYAPEHKVKRLLDRCGTLLLRDAPPGHHDTLTSYEGLGLSWNRCKVILRDDQFIEQRY